MKNLCNDSPSHWIRLIKLGCSGALCLKEKPLFATKLSCRIVDSLCTKQSAIQTLITCISEHMCGDPAFAFADTVLASAGAHWVCMCSREKFRHSPSDTNDHDWDENFKAHIKKFNLKMTITVILCWTSQWCQKDSSFFPEFCFLPLWKSFKGSYLDHRMAVKLYLPQNNEILSAVELCIKY